MQLHSIFKPGGFVDCGFVAISSTSALCRRINCGTMAIILTVPYQSWRVQIVLFCFLLQLSSFGWTYCVIIGIYKDTCQRVSELLTLPLWWILKRFPCCVQWLHDKLLLGPAFGLMFGGTSGAVLVIWLTPMTMVIPIDYGVFVVSLQVRTSLWFVVTVAMSGIMVNVLAFQCCRVMSCPEIMRNMCAPYVFNLPMISLFSGLFQTFPRPLFSGACALVLSFVMLLLSSIYIIWWNFTLEAKLIPGPFWLLREGFCYGTCLSLSSICWLLEPGIYCTKGMLCFCCLDSPEA